MRNHYEHLKESKLYWPDNSIYFLTDSTFLHFPYFNDEIKKQIVLNQIKKINTQLGIHVSDYSISINHFHLKFYLKKGLDLKRVKQLLRGGISFEYKKKYYVPYNDFWQSRKILIIKSEEMNWKVSGYIIGNLLKHKEVSTFKELEANRFSSFWFLRKKYGFETAINLISSVINVEEDSWGVVEIDALSKLIVKR